MGNNISFCALGEIYLYDAVRLGWYVATKGSEIPV